MRNFLLLLLVAGFSTLTAAYALEPGYYSKAYHRAEYDEIVRSLDLANHMIFWHGNNRYEIDRSGRIISAKRLKQELARESSKRLLLVSFLPTTAENIPYFSPVPIAGFEDLKKQVERAMPYLAGLGFDRLLIVTFGQRDLAPGFYVYRDLLKDKIPEASR